MSNADASEIARNAARARWGSRVAVRAAGLVIARADQLPADVADAVSAALDELPGPGAGLPSRSPRGLVPADPEAE